MKRATQPISPEQEASLRDAMTLLQGREVPADDGELTRQRIQRSLRVAVTRRRRRAQVVALLAAMFTLSTAFAWYLATQREGGSSAAPPASRKSAEITSATLPKSADEPAPAPSRAVDTNPPTTSTNAQARQDSSRGTSAPSPRRRPPDRSASEAAASPATREPVEPPRAETEAPPSVGAVQRVTPEQRQALYMTAHQLQFRGAPQAALAAWDAYLATALEGPLAVEARYNRAVILVRMGQREAARQALRPFVDGTYGEFRHANASVLLKQLE